MVRSCYILKVRANMSSLKTVQNPDDEVIESNSMADVNDEQGCVIKYLDLAVQSAEDEEMPMSELIGLLFYYAHNLAHEARNIALNNQQ